VTVALEGNLAVFHVEELLPFLARSGTTGTLHLEGDPAAVIHLAGGRLQRIEDATERDAIVDALFELVAGDPGAFRLEGTDHPETDHPETDHSETGGDTGAPSAEPLGYAVDDVLGEVRGRIQKWQEVATTIPSIAAVVSLVPWVDPEGDPFVLSAHQWRLATLCDGRRSIAEVARLAGGSALDACAFLHDLISRGAANVSLRG